MLPNAKQLACLSVGGSFVRRACGEWEVYVGRLTVYDHRARRRNRRGLLRGSRRFSKPNKKERKKTDKLREGWEDTARRHHTGILRRECGASLLPPSGVYLFLSLFAVSRQFSQRPSCHLSFFPLSSSFSLPAVPHPLRLIALLGLVLRERFLAIPNNFCCRSETPLPSADPLLSLLLSPLCVTPPCSRHILAPRVYRALLAQGPHF